MKNLKKYVQAYISPLPAYVNSNETVESALKKMETFEIGKIVVCSSRFRVIGTLSKKDIRDFLLSKRKREEIDLEFLKSIKVKEVLNKETKGLVAYPECEINEIIDIMNAIKTKCLPIVKSPWNKHLEGFIRLDDIFLKTM